MTKQEFKQNILRESEKHLIPVADILHALGISDVEAQECIDELCEEGLIAIEDSKVVYIRRDIGGGK